MPPRPDPVEPDNDDDSERWKHDDRTERSPRQMREDEREAFDAHQRWIYETMKKLKDELDRRLRNPWRQDSAL